MWLLRCNDEHMMNSLPLSLSPSPSLLLQVHVAALWQHPQHAAGPQGSVTYDGQGEQTKELSAIVMMIIIIIMIIEIVLITHGQQMDNKSKK